MDNILITGGNGQLGRELRNILKDSKYLSKYTSFFTDLEDLDITDLGAIKDFVKLNNINIIINCAAYTAVDRAETEQVLADKVNNLAVKNLAKVAKENAIKFVHISTDYVFDGINNKPYIETDTPNPKSVYGKTKLLGEQAVLTLNPENTIIIRTSWVYSEYGNNFVKTMIKLMQERDFLNIVADQVGTPTYARDLASAIVNILEKINNKTVEIYHYSNEGVASWYDFTIAIKDFLDKVNCKIGAIPSSDYPTPAPRPYYSVLSKAKIKKEFGLEIPYWKDSLRDCMKSLV